MKDLFPQSDNQRPAMLVLTSTFPRWPDDREPPFVYELCRRLTSAFKITVICPHAPGAKTREIMDGIVVKRFRYSPEWYETLAYNGGILENLKKTPWKFCLVPFFLVGAFYSLARELYSGEYVFIHAHWLIPQGLIGLSAKKIFGFNIPIICTSHGGDLFALRGLFFKWLKKIALAEADGVTVVSQVMKREAQSLGCAEHKMEIIPMGVDLRSLFVPGSEINRQKQILFVGRLIEKKGVFYLIRALAHVLKNHPEARLLIVGSGPEEMRLRETVNVLRLDNQVVFCGPIQNHQLPSFYQSSAMVVFPSTGREGFGLVPVEALGCECPVLATDQPSICDIVADGETGLIVPQKDERALAEKIIFLLDHPEEGKRLARQGRQFVLERYEWSVIAGRYRQFMQRLIGE